MAEARVNNQGYPYVDNIEDKVTVAALRVLWDTTRFIQSNANSELRGLIGVRSEIPTNLSPTEAGKLFYSTDFDRTFRWSGSVWQDAPGQPTRYQIAFFRPEFPPSIGWARCDGSRATVTQSNGTVTQLTMPIVPALNGLLAWMRV